jgi:hypothetical protein
VVVRLVRFRVKLPGPKLKNGGSNSTPIFVPQGQILCQRVRSPRARLEKRELVSGEIGPALFVK